ncbi:hypothetical protein A6V39_03675 [Candidatus Mycoplasma haematobovis]|uniref:Uncharacterized protein n=1 Tax=Candidatus Mycoplasma haematobovis TaxID=432608 RepID=A0A1A9QDE9_9MOLU|nr:hypothetical protein [Candidatus Mycoplasma haematobovis]OAL09986.1 hypothetical protein A6V39_03675 [Candidatus Mycoplasma haematobovis]
MSTTTKVIATALVGSGAVGGGITYALINKKESISIEKQLLNDKKTLLTKNDQVLWTIKLSVYNTLKSKNTKIKLTKTENWGNLKSWCEEKVKEEFNDNNKELYEGISSVCTVPTNKEKLSSLNKALASTPEEWENRKVAYQSQGDITEIKKENLEIEVLKKWCVKNLEEEFTAENEGTYSATLKWCAKNGGAS